MSKESQPVNKIEWWHRDALWSNDYNPNNVAPPELALLRVSLLEDGWTLPLVIRPDGEIVDGEHRWTLCGEPDLYALTDGYVPVVVLEKAKTRSHQIASTIRYNRARGVHSVMDMADIVSALIDDLEWSRQDVIDRLGMEPEEVSRLYDHGNMRLRGTSSASFSKGWKPTLETNT